MSDLMMYLRGNKRIPVGSRSPLPVGAGSSQLNDASGTIAAAGTAQQQLPARENRQYLLILALPTNTDNLWVNIGANAAAAAGSIPLAAGEALIFEGTYAPYESVSVFSPTAGVAFTIKEG